MNICNIDNIKIRSVIRLFSEAPENETIYYNGCCNHYELIYTLSGHCIVSFQNITVHDRTGVIRYLPQGITNNTYRVDIKKTAECIDIFFSTESPMPDTILSQEFASNAALRRLFINIHNVWSEKKPGYYNQCVSLFYAILAEIEKAQAQNCPRSHRTKIEKAVEYIHSHYCDSDFDYSQLAALSGVSYTYFKKLFSEIYGTAPQAYVKDLKLRKACELLSTNRFSVSQVAEQCGYSNIYYFSKVFKEEMHVTPSRYTGR